MKLTTNITGFDALSLRFKYLISAAQTGLKLGVSEAAGLFETEAKAIVPVKTGALRDAIHTETVTDEGERQVLAVTPAYPAENPYGFEPAYARRIEYGFVGTDSLGRVYHQAPQPYMRPAFDGQKADATAAIKSGVIDQVIAASATVSARYR